ncbi:hypothetical protein L1049_001426 [Liquidambar formosana]|uniref:Uncharacterized protein n=1 Tax=Liquidambar formosana TaxID=63359 RepID=A0AAP0NE89_LIQFO
MAGEAEVVAEEEYESDLEEAMLPFTMRRRKASDDDDHGEPEYRGRSFRSDRGVGICSDGESEGLGGAPECDFEEDEFEEEEEEEEEDEVKGEVMEELSEFEEKSVEAALVIRIEEEKKEREACVTPMVGAFYMHDDRFRDNGRCRRHRKVELLKVIIEVAVAIGEETLTRGVQPGSIKRCLPTSVVREENLSVPRANAFLQGRTIADSIGRSRLYIGGSVCPGSGSHLTNPLLQSLVTPSTYMAECSQSMVQRRVLPFSARLSNQPTPYSIEVDRVSSQMQHPVIQRRPVESTVRPSLQVSTKKLGQLSLGLGSEPCELESLPGPSGSKLSLSGNRRRIAQGSGRGSLLYGGTDVDNNFPASPTLLPALQYEDQHHGGLGVPAVLPVYAAQSQLGFGNSEMAWCVNFQMFYVNFLSRSYFIPHLDPLVLLEGDSYDFID